MLARQREFFEERERSLREELREELREARGQIQRLEQLVRSLHQQERASNKMGPYIQ